MKYLQNTVLSWALIISVMAVGVFGQVVGPELAFASKPRQEVTSTSKEEMVMFNTQSLKYHKPSCIWAQRCTRNCILIPRSEAQQRGGIPCKVCGG